MVAALLRFAGILLDGWVLMLLAGGWHHELTPAVPAIGYPQAVLVALTLTYLAFFWMAPAVAANQITR